MAIYKITFNANCDNPHGRDMFNDYISAVRDGLDLADACLGIYPKYENHYIQFEIKVTDNLLELSNDKHFRFINRLKSVLFEYRELLVCEQIN